MAKKNTGDKNAQTASAPNQPKMIKFKCIGTEFAKTVEEYHKAPDQETASKIFNVRHPHLISQSVCKA